ncbi:MAG: hypothetical protein L0Y58_13865 [Verrucomicrobia subdivision 3 bacterium]|nr:hypothetical protein [Limisphaerales bacterium]
MARRLNAQSAFGEPALIKAIVDPTGQRSREPVALSPDGATLYYIHFQDGVPNRGGGILSQVSVTALPQLLALGKYESGRFQIELLGREGTTYEIEVSSDLETWKSWRFTVVGTSDPVVLTNRDPTRETRGFYRALGR